MSSIALTEEKKEYLKGLYIQALTLRHQQKWEEAKEYCEEILTAIPFHRATTALYVDIEINSGNIKKAISTLKNAIKYNPKQASFYVHLGQVLIAKLGDVKSANAIYMQALKDAEPTADLYYNIGTLNGRIGDAERARIAFEKSIEVTPNFIPALVHLVDFKQYNIKEEEVRALEDAYCSTAIQPIKRYYIGFALGKVYEDKKEYDKAFEYYEQANKQKRQEITYSVDVSKNINENLKRIFTPNILQHKDAVASQDDCPIFVLGMLRSGTSLVEQILASHPNVFGAGELHYLNSLMAKMSFSSEKDFNQRSAPQWKDIGVAYLNALQKLSPEAKRIVDKMPPNYRYIGFIKMAFPNAKIIHCRRNPISTCFSIFKINFGDEVNYAYNQKELAQYYLLYHDLMNYWRETLGDDAFLDIQYEELVNNPQENMRKLLDYCGLEWDDNVERFYETKRPTRTASINQVNQPMYKDSLAAWKPYEKHLQPMIDILQPVLEKEEV